MTYEITENPTFSITQDFEPQLTNKLELVDDEREIYKFTHNQPLPANLPDGYCFMGGVARNIILAELGNQTMPPRDIDIVAITDFNPDISLIDELSRKHMPDDYKHGHGIKIEKLGKYFDTRDFTINEVLVRGQKVYATKQGLHDLKYKIIRPTQYEARKWYNYDQKQEGISPKLAMKALRLHAEFEELYGEGAGKLEGIEEWQWEIDSIPIFYLALALDKAYQQGDALATKFYITLLKLGTIDTHAELGADSTRKLAMNIRYRMLDEGEDPFVFSNEQLNIDPDGEPEDEVYAKYAKIANTYLKRARLSKHDEY
jgi:hypothetical protein